MANALETEISQSLKAMRGVWYLKIPDVPRFTGSTMRANIPRPFDYIILCESKVVAIECKQTKIRTRFDLGNMKAKQCEQLARFYCSGGIGYVVVNFRNTNSAPRRNVSYCLSVEDLLYWYYQQERSSIPYQWIEQNCTAIPRLKIAQGRYGWDLRVCEPFTSCKVDVR
jgi:penicillin-binding protein-related factor A (putative recombinase)